MNVVAREHFRKGSLIPLVSWKIESVTAFGDHLVEFDLVHRKVFRSTGEGRNEIARVHEGHKGRKLADFFGTVESDTFVVRKSKQNWLSTHVVYETTWKASGTTVSTLSMLGDYYNDFTIAGLLRLRLVSGDRAENFRIRVEGTCADDQRDLAEILACLLLHHHETDISSS